ncbi:hypothetical protein ALC53_00459 [Atta colombica]|uniref:Uncharacterized protein n=1 Tax=Atta colombica TaxID=520822 RepID=A0A195BYA6_9HYME|nr:hypothetical protein ALC53_00459 [Atta colombica]
MRNARREDRKEVKKEEEDGEVADGCSRPTGEEVGSRSVTVCLWRLEKKIARLLDKRREGRRLAPDLSVLRRTEIQQRAAVLIAGCLLADERIDAEIALLVDARRMTSWQRRDPGGGRIDLPDRRRRDGHWFVERWRRFQETAEFQRLQGRWREV